MHYESSLELTSSEYSVESTGLADMSEIIELSQREPDALIKLDPADLAEWILNGDSLVVRDSAGRVVAHYAAQRWPASGAVELRTAIVHPDHRGHGINTAMLEQLVAKLHDEGIEPFVMTRPAAQSRGILERAGGVARPLDEIPDEVFSYCPNDCYRRTDRDCGCVVYRLRSTKADND